MGSQQSAPSSAAKQTVSEKFISATPTIPSDDNNTHNKATDFLSVPKVQQWDAEFSKNPKNVLSQTVLSKQDIPTALVSRATHIRDPHVYSHKIAHDNVKVTNQMSSGRCWLFATTNLYRINVTQSLKLGDDFELSQGYLFFYDKLEKANYYLENSIDLAKAPLDDRVVTFLSQSPIGDGGQQDMAKGLIEKYGLIPKSLFPETYHSSNSGKLNSLLTSYLRQSALNLRKLIASGASSSSVRIKKEEYMQHVFDTMAIALGTPPKPDVTFTWEYNDKDGKYHSLKATPLEFADKFKGPYPYTESFSLIHDPRNDYSKLYTVDRLGNIWGGRKVLYVNTQISKLKESAIRSIKANQAVFFGCDVGAFSTRTGEMDLDLYDYKNAIGLDFGMTKAERLMMGDSAMTHAMVITAVHLDDNGKPVRWRVENSWSDAAGEKGFMVMSDRWFDEFVYQVVVHKSLADKDLVAVMDQDPVVLPAYDPLGALA
ncbi:peptidase c1b bleomycin hydrolase [Phaffia rhodozyma]|uniref:Cysteine proteinase 1, mitochondrial n=1 Tax=Phaffia rhodozyma TaxID=264483 RepID=A0A0F7SLI2_PHARH|nr:peptidase c1b bleomycin hydrolase [Phaffia rhodozyma]